MKLVTRKQKAARIASTYYPDDGRDHPPNWFTTQSKLRALGDQPEPDEVDEILGSPETWFECSACGQRVERAAVFDYDPGEWGTYLIALCRACVTHADVLLAGAA